MLLQADGLNHTSASSVAFLTQGSAVLVPIWVALHERRLPGFRTILCVVMVIVGVAILGQFDWHAMRLGRGEIETLVASCFFAGQILWLDRPIFRGNDMLRVSLVMFLTIAFILSLVVAKTARSSVKCAPSSAPDPDRTLPLAHRDLLALRLSPDESLATARRADHCRHYLTAPSRSFATALALFLPAMLARWLQIDYPNEVFTRHLLIGGGLITAAECADRTQAF
jgi:hypothetical protein